MADNDLFLISQKSREWNRLGPAILDEIRRRLAKNPELFEQFVTISETQGYLEDKLVPIREGAGEDVGLVLPRFSIFFENSGNASLRHLATSPEHAGSEKVVLTLYRIARALDPNSLGALVGLICFYNGSGNKAEAVRCLGVLQNLYTRLMASDTKDLGTHQRMLVKMEKDAGIRKALLGPGFDVGSSSYKDLIAQLTRALSS